MSWLCACKTRQQEISLDLADLVAELATLCDPYYEHEQPIYEL